MKRILVSLVLFGIAALGSACSEDRFDCRDICETAQDCISVNIDVSACTDQCTGFSQSGPNAEAQAEQCNDCLDQAVCGGASPCTSVCNFITLPLD